MSIGYSKYALNINMRQLTITPESFNKVIEGLNESNGSDFKEVYSEMLWLQYNDYLENVDKPREFIRGRRRIGFAGLIGDRHGMLISSGCCLTEYRSIYTIDYLNQLDLLFALAFNMTLEKAQKGMELVLEGKTTSKEYLALILLTNICDIDKPTDVTIGDFNKIEEVREFLLGLIRNEIYNDQPLLSNIEGINYLEYLEIDDNPTTALSVALMIKLIKAVDKLNRKLVVQHYSRPGGGIVLSQDYSSLSFATNGDFEAFTITHKGESIKIPVKEFRRS